MRKNKCDHFIFTFTILLLSIQSATATSTLTVIVKIDAYPNTTKVEQGTTVVLVCRVVGVPYGSELTYSWTCASGSICDNPSEPPQHGSRRQYNNTVVVDIVKEWDNGDYKCSVSNRINGVVLGSDTHRISVTVGIAIYIKISSQYPGIYFPRNSFVTDGTPILIERNTKYRILCYSSGAGQVSWYYRSGTKLTFSGPYTSYYITQDRLNQLTRIISRNPTNEEFYCQGNQRTAWFGMFVNPNTTSLTSNKDLSVTQLTQHSITLSWTSVSGSSGYYISYERLDFSVPVTPTYMRLGGSESTSVTLKKLTAGTQYVIRVWTMEGSGVSQPIEKTVKTQNDIPSPPRLLRITRDIGNGVELNWLPPVNPNGVITSYEIEYTTNSTFTTINGTVLTQNSLTHYNWTGPEFPTYYMRVRVVNSANTTIGTMSEPSNVIKLCLGTERAPDKPTGLREITEQANTTSVYIEWDESPPTTCDGVTWYELSYTMNKNFSVTNITTNNTHYNLTGLVEDAIYCITLVAVNAVGKSHSVILFNGEKHTPSHVNNTDPTLTVAAILTVFFVSIMITVSIVFAVLLWRRKRRKDHLQLRQAATDLPHINTETQRSENNDDMHIYSQVSGSKKDRAVELKRAPPPVQSYRKHSQTVKQHAKTHHSEEIKMFLDKADQMYLEGKPAFEHEFKSIAKQTTSSVVIGQSNRKYNRFKNIYPYDFSRVCLSTETSTGSDYINASFVDGYHCENGYIASQAPTVETVNAFWQMITENKPLLVVMVTKFIENGKSKCEEYFPLKVGEQKIFGPFRITTVSMTYQVEYKIRTIEIILQDETTHTFEHYFFTGWPDHGVPKYPTTLLRMLYHIREIRKGSNPMLVHCSAGVGRTGTFIALDYILDQINAEQTVDIKGVVEKMRQNRMFMVQTVDQYMFLYNAIREMLLCGDSCIASYDMKRHVMDMSHVLEEGESGFETQFKILGKLTLVSSSDRKVPGMKDKVRYKDKAPVKGKHLYVSLGKLQHMFEINASLVDGHHSPKAFIAAQTPMATSILDFWTLICETNCSVVVLVCPLFENDQESCYPFWPNEVGIVSQCESISITCIKAKTQSTLATYKLTVDSENRTSPLEVSLNHFTTWTERGRPDSFVLFNLLSEVDKLKQHQQTNSPVIVACNDGLGRSCTFIAIWSLIEQLKTEGQIDVLNTVKSIRTQRPGAIPELEQYILCHEVVVDYLDAFEEYSNFKY